MGTYLYKYNLTVLFVSPSKIAHDKFYIYCPPLLLNEMYAHADRYISTNDLYGSIRVFLANKVVAIALYLCAWSSGKEGWIPG